MTGDLIKVLVPAVVVGAFSNIRPFLDWLTARRHLKRGWRADLAKAEAAVARAEARAEDADEAVNDDHRRFRQLHEELEAICRDLPCGPEVERRLGRMTSDIRRRNLERGYGADAWTLAQRRH